MATNPKVPVKVINITVNVRGDADVQGVIAQVHAAAHRAGANGLVQITVNGELVNPKKTTPNTAPPAKKATTKKAPTKKEAPAKKSTKKKR